jgi:hypothetical protein
MLTLSSLLMEFRFVDRDMMMRYHIGLGVGHAYAHGQSDGLHDSDLLAEDHDEVEVVAVGEEVVIKSDEGGDLGDLDNRHEEDTDACESDEEELAARVEMYGR